MPDYTRTRRAVMLALTLLALLLAGCQSTAPSVQVPLTPAVRLYGPASPFNQAIPEDAVYTPEDRISAFRQNWEEWSMPIYRLTPGEAVPAVTVVNRFSGRSESWPIPAEAEPAPEEDRHMGVMDGANNIIYEMWDAQWQDGRTAIRAGGMNGFPLDGTGISDPPEYRVTASGFAVSAGMVVREDFADPATGDLDGNRRVNHALSMSLPFDLITTGALVPPAVGGEENGRAGAEGIPMGARFALPRDLDLDSLGDLHPFTLALLQAARDYGLFVNDTNGAPLYHNRFVGAIRVEPGLFEALYDEPGDDLIEQIQREVGAVIAEHGIFRVTAEGGS